MIFNEDKLGVEVFQIPKDYDELATDYTSQPPNSLQDRYNLKNLLDKLEQTLNNLPNTNMNSLSTILMDLSTDIKPFLKMQRLMLQTLLRLESQVALQDKILGSLLCNENARKSLKADLETSSLGNLEKMELMEKINRISSYENTKITSKVE